MQVSRFHVVIAFIALMLLRISVGFHFFKEGADKIHNGFTAEYFLKAAKGPLASHFHSMVSDDDGALRFGLVENQQTGRKELDSELTLAIWDDFIDRAVANYRFGDKEIEDELVKRRQELASELESSVSDQNAKELESLQSKIVQELLALRDQREMAEQILKDHCDEFDYWLNINRNELLAYFETSDRLDGFDRDGNSRGNVSVYVDSLREQVTTIRGDRTKQKNGWAAEVDSMWDSFESSVNDLAVGSQAKKPLLVLHRPFDQENSKLKWINRIIPWFDLIVGGLLIVGLFTRLASLCGAAFLCSVIATQPPWVPGTEPTYLYAIELVALLVIFATLAGRMGGLDFFFAKGKSVPTVEEITTP